MAGTGKAHLTYAPARRARRRRLRTLYVRMQDLFNDGEEKLAAGISEQKLLHTEFSQATSYHLPISAIMNNFEEEQYGSMLQARFCIFDWRLHFERIQATMDSGAQRQHSA